MRDNRNWKRVMGLALAMTMAAGVFLGVPAATASAKTSNKGAYINVKFDGARWSDDGYDKVETDEERKALDDANNNRLNANRYQINITHKNKITLKKSMKESYVVYVPVAALKDDDARFSIEGGVEVNGKDFGGFIPFKYKLNLQNFWGTVVTFKEDTENDYKASRVGNLMSVEKTKNYYVVTVKDMPLSTKLHNWDEQTQQDVLNNIPTKAVTARTSIQIAGEAQKMGSAKVFVSDITLKAKKTDSIKFTGSGKKKDYAKVEGWSNKTDKPVTAKVATIKY